MPQSIENTHQVDDFSHSCSTLVNEKNGNDLDKWYYIDKDMIPAKLTYLFSGAERSSTSPYLAIFFTSIGLNLKQVGYVFSFSYAGLMLGSIFWGVLADKTRAHRVLLAILCVCYAIFSLSLPLVSAQIGEKTKNQCPLALNKVSLNSTRKISMNDTFRGDHTPVSSTTLTYVMATLGFCMTFFGGSIYSYIDAGVIEKLKMSKKSKDFGKQFMFGSVGFGCATLISGKILDVFPNANISCYFGVFIVSVTFLLGSSISSQYLYKGIQISSQKEERRDTYKKDLWETLSNFEVNLFLITVLVNGFLYCVYLNYFFLFMKEINSPNILIGLTVAFGSTSGLIVNFFNGAIIKLLRGTFNTLNMCTLIWSARYFIFYYLKNPWFILPLQLISHGLSLSLFFSVKSEHLKIIAPKSVHTTMFGIVQCLHSGVSMIIGSLVGGELFFSYGARKMFLFTSIFALTWSCILSFYFIAKKCGAKKNICERSKFTPPNESATEKETYLTKF